MGRDGGTAELLRRGDNFNPRAPRGARPSLPAHTNRRSRFQSTRPSRGATDAIFKAIAQIRISIHAPLAGRDRACRHHGFVRRDFNPRAPRGARLVLPRLSHLRRSFQSTRPSRGATKQRQEVTINGKNFNPRAPRGARLGGWFRWALRPRFQSTRPSRGATRRCLKASVAFSFQSTRPSRGAT